ncbi:MAG: DUF2914 domain-containing protein [Patescibacteria group bacterium]|nr:DUF2914 domain-containing protein [Patescibacteria group bacterium]
MDFHSTRAFKLWQRYEHHLGLGALVVGFIFDLILAKRPDSIADNTLLLSYLFIAGATIIILNLRQVRRMEAQLAYEPFLLLLILQFCFGGLASNLLVLYGKSGTLAVSAIFVGLLVAMVLGNEYVRTRYSLLRLNVAVYYFLLLTYFVLSVPTFVVHSVGALPFLLSVFLSLVCIALFLSILWRAVLRGHARALREVSLIVAIIASSFTGLYFLNVIPPVPLSLKDIGVYHSLLRTGEGSYIATYEPAAWWQFWLDTSSIAHVSAGESLYCFSSVFAPTGLEAPIYHRWEHYDPQSGQWQTRLYLSFPISGGRSDGYRGYSTLSSLDGGDWRCSVETSTGALIGRESFSVEPAPPAPVLSTATL